MEQKNVSRTELRGCECENAPSELFKPHCYLKKKWKNAVHVVIPLIANFSVPKVCRRLSKDVVAEIGFEMYSLAISRQASCMFGELDACGHNAQSARQSGDIIQSMSADQLSDEELIVRYRSSEDLKQRDQAVNELFRRNYTKVARWCLRFAEDRETAADLAQEILTRVHQNLDDFQGESRFSTWLFTIARNHCLNFLRTNSRQATALRADVEENFFEALPDFRSGPHEVAEREALAQEVRGLLNEALDETEKAVFTLHYGEDVPLESITRLLGLQNQSGAKAYIVSAKRKLSRMVPRWKARVENQRG